MDLQPGRVDEMVRVAGRDGTGIICHDTLGTKANAICRGYWEKHRWESVSLRMAVAMGVVEFVKVEKKHRSLSPRAWQVMEHIDAGRNPFDFIRGRAAHGGLICVLKALFVRGFVDRTDKLTHSGRHALHQHRVKRAKQ